MTVPLCWLNGYPVFTAHAAMKLRQEEDVVGQANARAIRYRIAQEPPLGAQNDSSAGGA